VVELLFPVPGVLGFPLANVQDSGARRCLAQHKSKRAGIAGSSSGCTPWGATSLFFDALFLNAQVLNIISPLKTTMP